MVYLHFRILEFPLIMVDHILVLAPKKNAAHSTGDFCQELVPVKHPAGWETEPMLCLFLAFIWNAWFWHTFQLMTFAVPMCFGFFLAFCNVFCIHELAKSASFFCNYVSSFFQVLADFCTPFCLSPRMQSTCHPDWTVSFKTSAVFWNKQAPVFSHLHCQDLQCLNKEGL